MSSDCHEHDEYPVKRLLALYNGGNCFKCLERVAKGVWRYAIINTYMVLSCPWSVQNLKPAIEKFDQIVNFPVQITWSGPYIVFLS